MEWVIDFKKLEHINETGRRCPCDFKKMCPCEDFIYKQKCNCGLFKSVDKV